MKMKNRYIAWIGCATILAGCSYDNPDEFSFGDKVYINAVSKTTRITLKNSLATTEKIIEAGVPTPAAQDIKLQFAVDQSLVNTYNETYHDTAIILPETNYQLQTADAVILKGTTRSTQVVVTFLQINTLPRDKTYVLPVSIVSSEGIGVLRSARTAYYVLKGGALINVVADMEDNNYISIANFKGSGKPSSEPCNNLSAFTWEALVNVHKFQPGIQSVMGIEGYFLLRISDNGLAPNQLQLTTPYGSMTSDKCMLQPERWTHLAVTFDIKTKSIKLYIDGEVVTEKSDVASMVPASFGREMGMQPRPFHIGYSYEKGRELDGEICECRIWNICRTPEQLIDNAYEVEPTEAGLVAYWKFNEGVGQLVKDYSPNKNHGEAFAAIKWTPVQLPAMPTTDN